MEVEKMQKWLFIYVIIINIVSIILMHTDKKRAIAKKWRIPEKALFVSALLGGSLGSVIGMYLFRHKTKHWYFVVGMPLILVLQLLVAGYLMFR